jgi:hypothetical protein
LASSWTGVSEAVSPIEDVEPIHVAAYRTASRFSGDHQAAHARDPNVVLLADLKRGCADQSSSRIDAARMLKRRLAKAGIVGSYSPYSFRASELTRFL